MDVLAVQLELLLEEEVVGEHEVGEDVLRGEVNLD